MPESYLSLGDDTLFCRHSKIVEHRPSILLVHGLGDSGLAFAGIFEENDPETSTSWYPTFWGMVAVDTLRRSATALTATSTISGGSSITSAWRGSLSSATRWVAISGLFSASRTARPAQVSQDRKPRQRRREPHRT